MRDFRVALRTLSRSQAYALSVVLTLALGIGAATAAYSVYQLVVVNPLPYAAPDRVMMVAEQDSADNVRPVSYPTFLDWKEGAHALIAIAGVASAISRAARDEDRSGQGGAGGVGAASVRVNWETMTPSEPR